MKSIYFLAFMTLLATPSFAQELLEVEGSIKMDSMLKMWDGSTGATHQVGTLHAIYPANASSSNSPAVILRTETSPISSNSFADIILESSDHIYLNTNTEERLTVGPSGRVGIGTTSPSALLHVTADAVIGGGSQDYGASSEHLRISGRSDNWYVGVRNESDQNISDFFIGKSGVEDGTFHIQNDGDVGIGTTAPTTRLHVRDSGGNPMRLETTSDDNYMTYFSDAGYVGYQGVFSNDVDMDFGTGVLNLVGKAHLVTRAIPRLTVDGLGFVGIGTTSPMAKMHVSGGPGAVELLLEADTNNSGEADQPKVTLSQDGGAVTGELGYFNATNNLRLINHASGARIELRSNGDIIIGN